MLKYIITAALLLGVGITAFIACKDDDKTISSEDNKKAGEQFLAENAQRQGITVTQSGLQYEVLTEGTGKKPKASSRVKCHYQGKLIDGTTFDSSYSRHQPATFALYEVIPGWTEGLQYMTEGSRYRLYLPYNLAYGASGAGIIPPYSALIFEVELLEVLD